LFACATWGFFAMALSEKETTLSMGGPAIRVVFFLGIFVSPISVLFGMPSVLFYLVKKPAMMPRTIYGIATLVLALSYLYLVKFNAMFDGGS
jgi:hypothetical protein